MSESISWPAFILLIILLFPLFRGGSNKKHSGGGCRQARPKTIGSPSPTPQPSTHSIKNPGLRPKAKEETKND